MNFLKSIKTYFVLLLLLIPTIGTKRCGRSTRNYNLCHATLKPLNWEVLRHYLSMLNCYMATML